MARTTRKTTTAGKTKKNGGKTLASLILVVLLLIGDFVYTKLPAQNGDASEKRSSIIETILQYLVESNEVVNEEDKKPNSDTPIENNDINETGVIEKRGEYTSDKLIVYFFDVGQADAILLILGDEVMLVDTGNAGDAQTTDKLVKGNINLTRELKRLGITKIDKLVLTHAHEDHMGSAYKIINAFEVVDLYATALLPEEEWTNYYRRFVEALENSNTHLISPTTLSEKEIKAKVEEYNSTLGENDDVLVYNASDYIRIGDVIPFGTAMITMIAPASAEYSDTNDYSIVLMVEFEGVKLLLTGDAGEKSEEEILKFASDNNFDLNCDILKVGHHGSRTANTEEFIAAVKPEYSIVMVAEGNSYGLPDEDVYERLLRYGTVIYETMSKGDIKLVIDNGEYEFDFSYSHEEKTEE